MTDLWPLVEAEIRRRNPSLHGLDMHTIETKWRRGAAEHGDTWTAWRDRDFREQIEAEQIDLMCYRAMRAVAANLRRDPNVRWLEGYEIRVEEESPTRLQMRCMCGWKSAWLLPADADAAFTEHTTLRHGGSEAPGEGQ